MNTGDEMQTCAIPCLQGWSRFAFVARVTCALMLSVFAALVPVSVDVNPVIPSGVNVHRSEANAATPVSGAAGYLEALAGAAGVTPSQLVAGTVGIVASATGMNIATESGVSFGNDLSTNLSALVYAADYPDYDLLSADEQTAWGSKQNYDAAKYNALMYAFGLGDSVGRYYASSGGDFDFNENELNIISHLGEITQTWMRRGSNLASDLAGLVDKEKVIASYGPIVNHYTIPDNETEWPSGWPRDISVYDTDVVYVWNGGSTYFTHTDRVVKVFVVSTGSGAFRCFYYGEDFYRNGGNYTGYVVPEWEARPSSGNYGTATPYIKDESTEFYYYIFKTSIYGGTYQSPPPILLPSGAEYTADACLKAIAIMNGLRSEQNYVTVINYPSSPVADETPVYYPGQNDSQPGTIERETPWQQFIENPDDDSGTGGGDDYIPPGPDERPENPYNPPDEDNPQYQSGTPEWKETTTENMTPLLNVRLDRLFPFCLVFDLQRLWDRFNNLVYGSGGLGGQAVVNYNEFHFPIDITVESMGIDYHTAIDLDLEPLHDLLLITKPFVFWLLVIMLLTSIIQFWKRILTGG